MPELTPPPAPPSIDIDATSTPYRGLDDSFSRDYALKLVDDTFFRLESWRTQNCDDRWRLNEWLYYGYVPPRTWEGTSIPRSSLPVQVAFEVVEGAHANIVSAVLQSDEVFGVSPERGTSAKTAQRIRDRLTYVLDHNLDDYGWTARMECKLVLRDGLIYGNGFGLIDWDPARYQGVIQRLDARDVYVDPATPSPYLDAARVVQIRKLLTISEVEAMRSIEGARVPSREMLNWFAKNRKSVSADWSKSAQESSRGVRYMPGASGDDMLPYPADQYIEIVIHMERNGREVWTINRDWVLFDINPYGCRRLVSFPCFPVPNRFYAQSLVDLVDPIQQTKQALWNRRLDLMNLATNPPRAAKRGVTRTPTSLAWFPGAVKEYDNPKDDLIVFEPQNTMDQVHQELAALDLLAERVVGLSSMASSGIPRPSNANRTAGGIAAQLQGSNARLGQIASNFEDYFLVPALYKLLKIETAHTSGGSVYGRHESVGAARRADRAIARVLAAGV